jgi:hypothetical protein
MHILKNIRIGFGPVISIIQKIEFSPTPVAISYKTVKTTLVFSSFHHYTSNQQQNKYHIRDQRKKLH